jgi:hypothetical protein
MWLTYDMTTKLQDHWSQASNPMLFNNDYSFQDTNISPHWLSLFLGVFFLLFICLFFLWYCKQDYFPDICFDYLMVNVREYNWFLHDDFLSYVLLKLLSHSKSVIHVCMCVCVCVCVVQYLELCTYNVMTHAKFHFFHLKYIFLLFCWFAVVRNSSTLLNRTREKKIYFLCSWS